jgi:flagellar hook-associated protein 3 FlgL
MRISSNTIFEAGIRPIQQQQVDLLKTQQQLATGRRILTPADDPVASARVLEVSQSVSLNEQYATNRKTAISTLSQEESSLGSLTSLIQDVQTVAVNGGNPALSDANRVSLATELRGRYQELLGLANSNDGNGQYLFAGYQGATKPFTETSPGSVAYNGDQGQRLIQTSASRQIAVSDAGLDIFQRIRNGNGTFVTAASSSNTGAGVIDGGSVLDPAKWAAAANKDFTIRFAGNVSVTAGAANVATDAVAGGIVDQAAWDASSKNLQISVAAGAVAGTFDYTITDAALGSYVVNYDPATQNPLSVSLDGSGGTFDAGIDLVLSGTAPQAGDTFSVAPSAKPGWSYDIIDNVTGSSLLTGAASAGAPYPRTYTSGSTISLKNQGAEPAFDYGAQLAITGAPAVGDTFTVKASSSESLFTTLDNLINALETRAGTRLANSLNTALTNLGNALSNVSTIRASVGSRLNEVDAAQSAGEDLNLQYRQTLSDLQDVDPYKAISDLTQQKMSLEAAQQSFLKISGLSLFNYL